MTTIARTQAALYRNQSQFRDTLDDALRVPVGQIFIRLMRYQGAIPEAERRSVLLDTGLAIQGFYASPADRQGYVGARPLSTYAELLNTALAKTVNDAAESQATWMKAHLPAHIWSWLTSARLPRNTQESLRQAVYNAGHFWIDPNGYSLSDRVWETSVRTRTALDRLLLEGINNGTSPDKLARRVEQFLLPSRAAIRTKKPYGSDGSFDAMRLARSEITRAHSAATLISSKANPFVDGMDWKLSARHPRADICDSIASIGMGGERLRVPYPLDEAPTPVESSHPQCICVLIPSVTKSREQVVAELTARWQAGELPPITPAAGYTDRGYGPSSFLNVIWTALGAYSAFEVGRWLTK
jgi:hypothetical protein